MAFEFTFLGTGNSQGVPIIGRLSDSFLANPKNHRTRSSIYVVTDEVKLWWTLRRFSHAMFAENIRELDAVLVTHAHTDHIMGMDDYRRFCDIQKRPLPIYATELTTSHLRRVHAHAFHDGDHPRGYFVPEEHVIDGSFEIGDLKVTPLALPHGSMGSTGYLFEQGGEKKLAYLTDAKAVPKEVVQAVKGVEVAVLDALRPEEHWTHMSTSEALSAAEQIGPGETIFTHLTHYYDHDIDQAKLPEGVRLAWDGLKVVL